MGASTKNSQGPSEALGERISSMTRGGGSRPSFSNHSSTRSNFLLGGSQAPIPSRYPAHADPGTIKANISLDSNHSIGEQEPVKPQEAQQAPNAHTVQNNGLTALREKLLGQLVEVMTQNHNAYVDAAERISKEKNSQTNTYRRNQGQMDIFLDIAKDVTKLTQTEINQLRADWERKLKSLPAGEETDKNLANLVQTFSNQSTSLRERIASNSVKALDADQLNDLTLDFSTSFDRAVPTSNPTNANAVANPVSSNHQEPPFDVAGKIAGFTELYADRKALLEKYFSKLLEVRNRRQEIINGLIDKGLFSTRERTTFKLARGEKLRALGTDENRKFLTTWVDIFRSIPNESLPKLRTAVNEFSQEADKTIRGSDKLQSKSYGYIPLHELVNKYSGRNGPIRSLATLETATEIGKESTQRSPASTQPSPPKNNTSPVEETIAPAPPATPTVAESPPGSSVTAAPSVTPITPKNSANPSPPPPTASAALPSADLVLIQKALVTWSPQRWNFEWRAPQSPIEENAPPQQFIQQVKELRESLGLPCPDSLDPSSILAPDLVEALKATPKTSNSGDISNTKAPPRSTTRTASGAGSAEPSALVALGNDEQAVFKRAALTNPKLSVKMPENHPIWNSFFEVASELKSLGLSRENEALVAAVMLQESNLVKAKSYTRAEARTWSSYIDKESNFNAYVADRPLLKSLANISLGQLDSSNPRGVKPSAKFILMFLEDVKKKIKDNGVNFDSFSEEQRVKIFTVAYNAGIDTGVRAAKDAGWASISGNQNTYRTVINGAYNDNGKKFGIALDYSQNIYEFYSGFKSGLAAIAIPVTNRQPQP